MPDDNMREGSQQGREREREREENRDPISGEPGAHPAGTAMGAAGGAAAGVAGGAAAGAATGTAAGGPVGAAIGGAAGAVAGGMAGRGIAERVNPTEEDAYWREHHRGESYYDPNYNYEDYRGAYRTGYEGYARWAGQEKRFEEAEPELRREYERNYAESQLSWEKARPAVRAAWRRFDRNLDRYIGFDVQDRAGRRIGELEALWTDHRGEPAFIGVRTGWLFGKTHVVPADRVEVNERQRRIRIPYDEDQVKNAPAYDSQADMTQDKEQEVYRYYGVAAPAEGEFEREREREVPRATPPPVPPRQGQPREEAAMQLSEEEVKVGKREVEVGAVRLRKIVRTETVNQPVELRREEVVVERVPAGTPGSIPPEAFEEQDIFIPLRREEAVVEKTARVREQVRVRKTAETERQQVSAQVRREEVEVEATREAEAGRRTDPNQPSAPEAMREREQRPRSQRRQKP